MIQELIKVLALNNITSYYVGGCVRDEIMGIESHDIDICLTGANVDQVNSIFSSFCGKPITTVGKSFPVWILDIDGQKYDFALARAEKKTGESRQDFSFDVSSITIEEDLKRRDITINAIAQNCLTGEFIDPFGGINDIRNKVCREVSNAFAEDALRVYRAARFIAVFGLTPTSDFINICRALSPINISSDRVGRELKKLFESDCKASAFFYFLNEVGWLPYHFYELDKLIGVMQSPLHHPEGDAFIHSMFCLDEAKDVLTKTVMLCHDLGKSITTVFENGDYRSPGHAEAGLPLTDALLRRLSFFDGAFQDKVALLVELHMCHINEATKRSSRKLLSKLERLELNLDHLVEVCRCDVSGRPPLKKYTPDIGQNFVSEMKKPIVNGTMLMEMGIAPGKEMGILLKKLLTLQDEGVLTPENWKEYL